MSDIRSMTGYGRAGYPAQGDEPGGYTFSWEVKSVNGRHLDVKYRLPFFLRFREGHWDKIIRKNAGRGRVDVSLNVRILDPELLEESKSFESVRVIVTLRGYDEAEYRNFQQDKSGLDGSLTGHACVRVLLEDRVDDRIADLVTHLVRMTLRNRLTGKQQAGRRHEG